MHFFRRWCEVFGSERCHFDFKVCIFALTGQVGPFVRVFIKIIEFLTFLSVSNVAPVPVDDRIFTRMHMRKENGAVFGFVRVG